MTTENKSSVREQMVRFFEQDGWPAMTVPGSGALQITFQGQHGNWVCYAQARDDASQLAFYSVCPVNAPELRRVLVSEFITRANYGLIIGNFELDLDDGEIRYKTSIDVEQAELSSDLIQPLVYANVWTMDRYLPGLMAVIYGSASPLQAIEMVESETEGE
jgi:hypothetical protein